ncbi:Potassium channel SKOR [Linum perenne]
MRMDGDGGPSHRSDDVAEGDHRHGGDQLGMNAPYRPSTSGKQPWEDRIIGPLLRNESIDVTAGGGAGRPPFFIRPDNRWYNLWVHFILIWAIYSSFFTPLEFGFFRGLPENLFLLDIAGQFAFLVDIVVRFFVAYRDTHSYRLVYNRKLIALRYLRSRFIVDFLGCLPWDAIYKVCGRKEAVRYMLWIRLSRARRVDEFFEKLEKDIRINYLFTRIVKLLVVELYCTHTAACIFYYLATTVPPSKEGYTWIGSLQMGDFHYTNFREIDLWKRYITSLYFAIVTMATVGYGEIHAVNIKEMIFVMIYVSFDMILGAYLLGNMTALIVKGSKTEKFRDRMTDLIKYMSKNNLGKDISNEMKGHLRLQYDRSYTETTIFQDIPISIQTKISQKLYEPYLKEVTLFKGCSTRFLKHIATKVHEEFFLPGEVIIQQGHIVNQLYIVCHGELEEIGKVDEDSNMDETDLMHLQTYSSFGEVSFLCNIPQPHTVQVRDLCKVLRLDKQSFKDIVEIFIHDARIILNNLLEGKNPNLRKIILESDVTLDIIKSETELITRLNSVAFDGDLYKLKRLLIEGLDPKRTDYNGRSPLHVAASKGFKDITLFLIGQGLEINTSDNFGNTPLLEAIKNDHEEVASLLVKEGATLGNMEEDGGDFLCKIVARRNIDLLKRVLSCGVNYNARNYDERTALHIAASQGLYAFASLLVDAGASVLVKDRWGNTPLDEARVGGDKAIIQLLETTRINQINEFSKLPQETYGGKQRVKCNVFPFHPWDPKESRREGVTLWVPQTMDELIKEAIEHLKSQGGSILSENCSRIMDVTMIHNDQNLYLV